MNIYQFIKELNVAPANMVIAAQSALNSEVPELIKDLQRRSPVDTGQYKGSWQKVSSRFSSPGIIAGVRIRNTDPKASLMEFGLDPGTAPWYFPNSKKPSGKLIESGGKIWAGGITPGHQHTIGGAIDPVIFENNDRQLQIANTVASRVVKAI